MGACEIRHPAHPAAIVSTIVKPMHCDLSVSFGDPGQLAMPGSLTHAPTQMGRNLGVNGHVSNAVYADFLLDCVSELCPGALSSGRLFPCGRPWRATS